jgi:pimeloyl-ACP methyl ester carboxylesterase
MYYEIRGSGRPLVMLHGGFMTIEAMGAIVPMLAAKRRVIAVELEGHGRTADLDRPLAIGQMADDVAGLMAALGVRQADLFGFSLGGMTALRLAMKRPELVRKLVVVSAGYSKAGFYPSITSQWPGITAESLKGSPMEEAYLRTAPDPAHWPVFVGKMRDLIVGMEGWTEAEVRSIKAPTLLVLADADAIRPEHAVAMFRLLGGAPEHGGMGPLPESQLAIVPGTTHFNIMYQTDLLAPIVERFLDASGPPAQEPIMRSGAKSAPAGGSSSRP